LINFFLVNERYYFVDLPGYGYARVSKQERDRWKNIVNSYLDQRRMSLAVLLVDARVGPTANDVMLAQWLNQQRLPHLTCVTKSDKLSRGRLLRLLPEYAKDLEMEAAALLPFSARNKSGERELRQRIGEALRGDRS
jgi:GTP-binding protein